MATRLGGNTTHPEVKKVKLSVILPCEINKYVNKQAETPAPPPNGGPLMIILEIRCANQPSLYFICLMEVKLSEGSETVQAGCVVLPRASSKLKPSYEAVTATGGGRWRPLVASGKASRFSWTYLLPFSLISRVPRVHSRHLSIPIWTSEGIHRL